MVHFFLEYAVFIVIGIAIIAIVLLFMLSRNKAHPRATVETHTTGAAHEDSAAVARAEPTPVAPPAAEPVETSTVAPEPRHDTQAEQKPEPAVVTKPAPPATPEPVVPEPAKPEPAASEPAAPEPVAPTATTGEDDLSQMKGVGPKLVARLKELTVTRFDQIAGWNDADIARIDGELANFKGRIVRDNWIDQARLLAAGDRAGFEAKYGSLGK